MMAATTCEVHRPSDDQELTKILQNLADPMKTSSQTSFKREFGLLKSKKPAPGTWAYLINMTPVIQRCCQEKKFWPAAELEYLISQQCISPRNIQMVFETLSERKEIGMMSKALKSQPGGDVPESCLVIALQSFLSSEEEILEKVGNECQPSIKRDDSNNAACPFSTARSTFVDQVLEAPYDEVYLISSLKKLPFTMVLDLLKYLLHRMKTSPDQTYVDQLSQWKGHLIDAHATQLVISKDAHEILIQFSKEEDLNKEFVHLATEDLAPLLKVAMTRNASTGNEAMGQYCVETLHL